MFDLVLLEPFYIGLHFTSFFVNLLSFFINFPVSRIFVCFVQFKLNSPCCSLHQFLRESVVFL